MQRWPKNLLRYGPGIVSPSARWRSIWWRYRRALLRHSGHRTQRPCDPLGRGTGSIFFPHPKHVIYLPVRRLPGEISLLHDGHTGQRARCRGQISRHLTHAALRVLTISQVPVATLIPPPRGPRVLMLGRNRQIIRRFLPSAFIYDLLPIHSEWNADTSGRREK